MRILFLLCGCFVYGCDFTIHRPKDTFEAILVKTVANKIMWLYNIELIYIVTPYERRFIPT